MPEKTEMTGVTVITEEMKMTEAAENKLPAEALGTVHQPVDYAAIEEKFENEAIINIITNQAYTAANSLHLSPQSELIQNVIKQRTKTLQNIQQMNRTFAERDQRIHIEYQHIEMLGFLCQIEFYHHKSPWMLAEEALNEVQYMQYSIGDKQTAAIVQTLTDHYIRKYSDYEDLIKEIFGEQSVSWDATEMTVYIQRSHAETNAVTFIYWPDSYYSDFLPWLNQACIDHDKPPIL